MALADEREQRDELEGLLVDRLAVRVGLVLPVGCQALLNARLREKGENAGHQDRLHSERRELLLQREEEAEELRLELK